MCVCVCVVCGCVRGCVCVGGWVGMVLVPVNIFLSSPYARQHLAGNILPQCMLKCFQQQVAGE